MPSPDVDRLLCLLAPALLAVACDSPTASPAAEPTPASATPTPTPADAKAASPSRARTGDSAPPTTAPEPEPEPEPTPEPIANPTPKPEPTPPPSLELPEEADPAKEARPTCPSGTYCLAEETASKLKQAGSEQVMGCPADIALKPGVEVPLGFPMKITGFDEAQTKASRAEGGDKMCCYAWYEHCPGGRPLLDTESTPVVAPFRPGTGWSGASFELSGTPRARVRAGAQWLADAAAEHASVASFGRVALELLSLGAPPELLEQTHRAALDEIRHAKVCIALARACGASPQEPGPLPGLSPRPADLARFAADTFVEGCVGETTAALVMERAASGVHHHRARRALETIARDEAQHAALAWRSIAWAIEQGGERVRVAVHQAAAALRPLARAPSSGPDDEPESLASLGRLSPAQQARARTDAWDGIIEPLLTRL